MLGGVGEGIDHFLLDDCSQDQLTLGVGLGDWPTRLHATFAAFLDELVRDPRLPTSS
jgi:hypothetical protein